MSKLLGCGRGVVVALMLVATCAAVPSETARAGAGSKPARPNIVLVMCDDLGWGDPGFNGNEIIETPHLDEMAAAGLRFTRFYSAAPVCSPTRGSCMTGRHPYRYGIFSANVGHMRERELTLAELLGELGYRCGHFGKWHLGTLTKTVVESNRGGPRGAAHYAPPWEHGFDTCFSTEAKVPTWDPMLRPAGVNRRTWWDPVGEAEEARDYGTHYWTNGELVTENLRGDDSRVIMDRALPFIREAAEAGRPFFAVVWFHAPHLPVVAGEEYTKRYAKYDKYHQHYFGCITALDEQVGRLRKELRELGVAEDTLVTFCSDNGPEGNSSAPGSTGGLRGRKRDLFEGGVRVPGLVEWPAKVEAGSVTEVPCSTSDYLPTILEIVGVEMPDDRPLDGMSLLPVFAGKMQERPRPIGFQTSRQAALVDNRYKLVRSLRGGKGKKGDAAAMLFDLIDDPGEQEDLAEKHPEIAREMAETLRAWRASCERSLEGEDYGEGS